MMEKQSNLFEKELKKMNKTEEQEFRNFMAKLEGEKLEAVSASEKETLSFIRHRVMDEIQTQKMKKSKKLSFSWISYAAIFALVCSNIYLYFNLYTNPEKGRSSLAQNNIIPAKTTSLNRNDAETIRNGKALLADFSKASTRSSELILSFSIDESKKLLTDVFRLKERLEATKSSKELLPYVQELETLLLAISSLDSKNSLFEVRLIQKNIASKDIINKLDVI